MYLENNWTMNYFIYQLVGFPFSVYFYLLAFPTHSSKPFLLAILTRSLQCCYALSSTLSWTRSRLLRLARILFFRMRIVQPSNLHLENDVLCQLDRIIPSKYLKNLCTSPARKDRHNEVIVYVKGWYWNSQHFLRHC